ncbi:MAG: hypothetical protein EHM37_18800, partial [Deltaproteobacteria bacterium]
MSKKKHKGEKKDTNNTGAETLVHSQLSDPEKKEKKVTLVEPITVDKKFYSSELQRLQVAMVKLQEWIREKK